MNISIYCQEAPLYPEIKHKAERVTNATKNEFLFLVLLYSELDMEDFLSKDDTNIIITFLLIKYFMLRFFYRKIKPGSL